MNIIFWQDKLILCDRTHYDIVAPRDTLERAADSARSLIKALVRPDFCFLLYCPPDEINRRKPELPVPEIESQYTAYRAYQKLLGFREVKTSRCSNSIAQIIREINDQLLGNRYDFSI